MGGVRVGCANGSYAADASIIAADANRQNSTPKVDWNPEVINPDDAPRAVREYLETLDDAAFGAASPVRLSLSRIQTQRPSGLVHVVGRHILLILRTI